MIAGVRVSFLPPVDNLDRYIEAASRPTTRRSYESAIRHFELEWGGFLPASAQSISRYLADHAESLSISTLRHRLAALASWHNEHGFADPTRAHLVRQVLKGIRASHAAVQKQAKPLQIDGLQQIDDWLQAAIAAARRNGDVTSLSRHLRDRAFVLLGFWRGFRSDELIHLLVENLDLRPNEGLSCFLQSSKSDKSFQGRSFRVPALSRLCPVAACQDWIAHAGLREGPLFRAVDQWGNIRPAALHRNSVIALLRALFQSAGLPLHDCYSAHSLRRGFAGWAVANGWNVKNLMEYVGWKDVKAAMRYVDDSDEAVRERMEQGLQKSPAAPATGGEQSRSPGPGAEIRRHSTAMEVTLLLSPFVKGVRGVHRSRRLIEEMCLKRFAMTPADREGTRYRIHVPSDGSDDLDETLYALLDEMHRIADDNHCFLDARLHDPSTNRFWE